MIRRARRPQVDRRRSSLLRYGVSVALFVAGVGAWAAFAPPQFGGTATYVSTYGTSMEPKLHKGDLVLVRPESDYHVGQVVAYHSNELHTVVLHRIVDRDGDRFVFKGDNNTWLDTDRPERSQLIGSIRMVLPGGGDKLQLLHSPPGMGIATAIVVVPFLGVRKRKGRGQEPSPTKSKTKVPSAPFAESFTFFARSPKGRAFAGIAVATIVLAGYAWTRPLSESQTADLTLDEIGAFSYTADVPSATDVYIDGQLVTGEPIYLNLVNRIDVGFDYSVSAMRPLGVTGTARLDLVVSDSIGWTRTIPLVPDTTFTGEKVHIGGPVDLSSIRAMIATTEARTGVTHDTYKVSLRPVVHRTLELGAVASDGAFAPTLDLRLDELVLAVDDFSPDKLSPTKGGLMSAERTVPARASLLMIDLDVAILRNASLLLMLAAGMLLVAEYARYRREAASDESMAVTALGGSVVPVATVTGATAHACAVESLRDLVPLAEAFNAPILRLTDGSGSYVVVGGTTSYWYGDMPAVNGHDGNGHSGNGHSGYGHNGDGKGDENGNGNGSARPWRRALVRALLR